MKLQQPALALALAGFIAPLPVNGQALPSGDYTVMRLDFKMGQDHDLQYASLFHHDWTSNGEEQVDGTIVDCSLTSLIGNNISLKVSGNPYFYSFPWPPPPDPNVYTTGFINPAGDLFSLYKVSLPSPDNSLSGPIPRIGLGLRRATGLVAADLLGDWLQLYWEIEVGYPLLNVIAQGYELAQIQLRADGSGSRILISSSFDDNEDFTFTWRADGSDLVVDVEEEFRFTVGASRDVILAPVVETDSASNRQLIGFDLFMKRATTLAPQDVTGVWGMLFFDIYFGSGPWGDWKSMGGEKAMIELRPDLTGTLYSLALSDLQWLEDSSEMRVDFTWAVDGGDIVITAPDEEGGVGVHVFPVSAGGDLAIKFDAESGSAETFQELDLLVRLDLLEAPKPVRHIPLYEPLRDGWGNIGFAGSVYTGLWPWVYSSNLGWLYFAEGDGRRLWMHDRQLGWLLTDPLIFPYFLGTGAGEVYYLDRRRGEVTPDNRHFYAYHLGRWID
jgi:hypothetical protein